MKRLPILVSLLFTVYCSLVTVVAQTFTEEQMVTMLDKSLGKLESGSFAIKFEGITMGAKSPLDIFTLPAYKVFRGGYYYCDKNRFEMNLAGLKALCDGKVVVMIDEVNKQVMVDSINKQIGTEQDQLPFAEMLKYLGPEYADGIEMAYKGIEKVKGKPCHVISASLKASKSQQASLYYLTQKEHELILMAEKNNGLYDVYWINTIGTAPAKHVYDVNLPKRELHTLYGYEVTDLRF